MFGNLMSVSNIEDDPSSQLLNAVVGETVLVETIKEFLTKNQSLDLEVLELIAWVVSCCTTAKVISSEKTHELFIICKICL